MASSLQASLHNTSASCPKSQHFRTVPQNHAESLTAQLSCDRHAKEKKCTLHFCCVTFKPSNLEGIRLETRGEKPENSEEHFYAKKYLPCRILSSITPKAAKIENCI